MRYLKSIAAGASILFLCCSSPYSKRQELARFSPVDLKAELKAREAAQSDKKTVAPSEKSFAAPSDELAQLTSREILEEIRFQEKSIYGEDHRKEAFDASREIPTRNLRSTAALLRPDRIQRQLDHTWRIQARSFREQVGVCADEPFSAQPAAGFCTGFLIGYDRLATAGHCVRSPADLDRTLVVFGFQMRDRTTLQAPILDADVYRAVELLGRIEEKTGADWAVVRLDRAVAGRDPLPLYTSGKIPDSEGVYVIGHPVGLPQKIADHAVVRDNRPAGFFVSNLDTYGGNSGSPVFRARQNEVVGILVRGEQDFHRVEGGCLRSTTCPDTGCMGEHVTRIAQIPSNLRMAEGTPQAERLASSFRPRRQAR